MEAKTLKPLWVPDLVFTVVLQEIELEGYRVTFPNRLKTEIESFEIGEIREREALIETEASLISTGTELTALTGDFPDSSAWSRYVKYPFIAGYSSVGRIVDVGHEVEEFEVGDRVAATSPHATYAIVEAERLIKIPDNVALEEACFHTIASGAMNSVRLANISMGESVVVIGLGLLGQMATIFSRTAGAFPVAAVDLADGRLRLARVSGATSTLRGDRWEDVKASVEELTRGRMADKVFEVTGNPDVVPKAMGLIKRQGCLVVLSSPRGKTVLDFHDEVNSPSRLIIGTHFGSQPAYETPYNPWTRRRNTELFFDLISAGVLKINHLVTHRYPWREAEKAYKMLLEDRTRALGVILLFKTG
ncbi:MAG: zinc-binding dehydrogenase [Candidatus Bathyarchaeota archaeon]|nr:zinc-binding dehydrogenase [Candidatus Bathyarchaeota archaeon]